MYRSCPMIYYARKFFPHVAKNDRPTVFLLLDNLRFDQWKTIEPIISYTLSC